jgi:hypothetical protein
MNFFCLLQRFQELLNINDMERLIIELRDDSPQINFDEESGKMEISGKSLPENVTSFYKPVLDWLNEYTLHPKPLTEFTFKFTYFNTASSKLILDILMILEKIHDSGKDVKVNWHYPVYDEDMKEAGLEYSDMVDIPFSHFSHTP